MDVDLLKYRFNCCGNNCKSLKHFIAALPLFVMSTILPGEVLFCFFCFFRGGRERGGALPLAFSCCCT